MVVPPGLISPPLVSSRLLGDHLERDGIQDGKVDLVSQVQH
jgi:hypothetical protein